MDPRRLLNPTLMLTAAGSLLAGCAALAGGGTFPPELVPGPEGVLAVEEAIVVPVEPVVSPTEVPYLAATIGPPSPVVAARTGPSGRAAIAVANQAARAASRADGFVGGVQVFAWSPGQVFEVWTAPLRVTTLTLGEGETLVSKAAGDTIRWQIGEVVSGTGASQRTHVLLKPLERGLETNLVLTTSHRVYLLDLKSGGPDAFNAAIAWDAPAAASGASPEQKATPDVAASPEAVIDARYRIEPQGRRARWTPSSVFNDGRRTFITFDAGLEVDEAPVLFVLTPDGEAQVVNYRQQAGGIFVVDRLFDRAELRLGDRRPQVVRLVRVAGAVR